MNARTHLVPLAAAILAASLGSPAYAAASAPLRDLGRADASTRVDVALVLNYRNEAQLDQLIEAQADETSPLYHHFIDQAQFADYFAPSAADYARVIASLRRAGFTVTQTFANRTVVDASAPAPIAERYFNTEIHRVQQPAAHLARELEHHDGAVARDEERDHVGAIERCCLMQGRAMRMDG